MIATLSGGNQQKVVVARWMEAGSRLLVLEEPTFGVDVGSKAEIYRLLQEALDQGLAVLLISSDFEEVAGICHRALIFDRGRVTAELARDELSHRAADRARRPAPRKARSRRGWHECIRRCRRAASGRAPPTSSRSGTWRSCSSSLIIVFSLLKGDTFLTAFTFQSMVNSRSINAMVALAVMIPLASNNFDLSVASILGISQVLANGLQTQQGLPWQVAAIICVLLGAFVGLINGLLVTRAKINSFIATLGTGTLLLGLNQWYTGGTPGGRPAARRLRRPSPARSRTPAFRRRRLRADHRGSCCGSCSTTCRSAAFSTSSATARALRS